MKSTIIALLKASKEPIPKSEMFHLLNADTESKQRNVRNLLAKITDIPIGSDERGYYLCRNKWDLQRANAEDKSRSNALLYKISQREYAFANWESNKIVQSEAEIKAEWKNFVRSISR